MDKRLKPKETSIILASVFCAVTFLILTALVFLKKYIISESLQDSILTTSGVFIGFIIAALGIYYSVPLQNEVKLALKRQGYYNQISRNFIISLVTFFISSIICVVGLCLGDLIKSEMIIHIINSIILIVFLFGLTLCVSNCVNYFKVVKSNDK